MGPQAAERLGYAYADPADGRILVVASEGGIVYIGWAASDSKLLADVVRRFPSADLELGANDAQALADRVARLVAEPFSENEGAIPLDLRGTAFQLDVWSALRSIPAGSTMSYGEVAKVVGRPGAARAVGSACGANPVPIVVPCHRVIAGDGGLGGFSGKLERKKAMLEREGLRP